MGKVFTVVIYVNITCSYPTQAVLLSWRLKWGQCFTWLVGYTLLPWALENVNVCTGTQRFRFRHQMAFTVSGNHFRLWATHFALMGLKFQGIMRYRNNTSKVSDQTVVPKSWRTEIFWLNHCVLSKMAQLTLKSSQNDPCSIVQSLTLNKVGKGHFKVQRAGVLWVVRMAPRIRCLN